MATTYQESLGGTPEFYQQGYQDLLTQGKAAAALPYTAYPGQQVAGLSPLQQQALQLTAGNVGAFTPYATAAQTAAQGALGAAQFSPEQLSQFMNPYTSGVVNEIGRLGAEQFQNVINPALSSTFQGLGQAGSARQAALLADAAAKSQREILGQQANALNTGYQNAMQSYRDWSGLGAQTGLSTASTLGNLGQAAQQAGLTDVGALTSAGALQQGQEQKALDVGYQNWQQQQQYPWQQLTQYKSLFPAAPSVTESWQTSFKKGGLARYADGGSFSEDDDLIQQQINKLLQQNSAPAVPDSAMARQAMDMRQQFMQRLQQIPEAPPAPSFGEAAGQALMRASAAGPSNLGQLIGRAGTEYFDAERQRQKEAKADMLQRLMLEQRALPSVSLRGGPGTGGTGSSGFYMATDSDGRTWMINKATGERTPVAIGNVELNKAADRFAVDQVEKAQVTSAEERKELFEKSRQYYLNQIRKFGAVEPMGDRAVAESGDVPRLMEEVSRISDPEERARAERAVESSYPQKPSIPATPILTSGETKQVEEIGKIQGQEFGKILEQGGAAQSQLNLISNLERNLEGYQTGKLTPATKEIAAWVRPLGVDLDPNLGKKEAFESAVGQMALQLRNTGEGAGMPGSMSDSDREFLRQMTPRLSSTPEGNQLILDYAKRVANRSKEKAQMAREYRLKNPRGTLDGFDQMWMEYVERNPLFPVEPQPQVTPSTPSRIRITPEDLR